MKTSRILIASNFYPYPPNFGGVYDIYGRILELKEMGYSIDLIYSEKEKPKEEYLIHLSQYIDNFYFIKRKNKVTDLLSLKPLQVVSRKGFKSTPLHHQYDLLIIEGDYAGSILSNPTLRTNKKILRVHNNESLYFNNLASSTTRPLEKIYYLSEKIKFKKYSKNLYEKMDRLWFISHDEYIQHKKNSKIKSIHLPTPVNLGDFKKNNPLLLPNILFLGALFMPNNLEAIDWYLKNIHPKVLFKFPEYKFIIAGSTGNLGEKYFDEKYAKIKGVTLKYNLESLDEVYSNASIFVNPMQHGAGVKIKSIHSILNGLPLISSKIGAEGIGLTDGENFILGDTIKKFTNGIIKLLSSNSLRLKIANNGQQFLTKNNSKKILQNELNNIF